MATPITADSTLTGTWHVDPAGMIRGDAHLEVDLELVRGVTWYSIRVAGGLGATSLGAFPEFASDAEGSDTTLIGQLPDSSALYGAVARLEALGLELVDIRQLDGPPARDAAA